VGKKELKVDKEKVKAAYTRGLVSLEILKAKKNFKDTQEAEEYYDEIVHHRTYLVDDLTEQYVVRLSYTDKKNKLNTVDPEQIPEIDQYELSETIQDILRENMFPVIKSNFPQKEEDE
jgi:hypothetical protein